MDLDEYEADLPFQYEDQGVNTPPRAGLAYNQAEGDFIYVRQAESLRTPTRSLVMSTKTVVGEH